MATAPLQLNHAVFAKSATHNAAADRSSGSHSAVRAAASLKTYQGLKSQISVATRYSNELKTASIKMRSSRAQTHKASQPGQIVASGYKVAVLGAGGGIGQPLSLLIKMSPMVSSLNLYDIANVKGVAADLSHCNTPAKVSVNISYRFLASPYARSDTECGNDV